MINQNMKQRMELMAPAELKKFATLHKDDPFIVSMAVDIDNTRKAAQRQQAMQAAAAGPQPAIVDQTLSQIGMPQQMPPQQAGGIPALPAQNMEGMADGGIAGYAGGGTPEDANTYRAYAMRKAKEYGLDPAFVDRIFQTESEYNPNAKSPTGPQGIGQLTSYIAKRFGISPKERKDPYKNMDASIGFLDYLNKKYKGDQQKIAVAYNQGEPVLDAHLKKNKGQLVPEKLHEDVKTANKQEPLKYLQKIAGEGGTREAPRTPEMLAKQREAQRIKALTVALPLGGAQAADEVPRKPAAAPAPAQQDGRFSDASIPTPATMAAEEKRRKEELAKQPQGLTKYLRELAGAPEALTSAVTGAVAPATALVPYGISQLTGKPMTYDEAMDTTTFVPRTEPGKESLRGLHQALEDFKVPPYIPGIGSPRRAPARGPGARAAALATEAELAAARDKVAAPRLGFTPAPEAAPAPKTPLAVRMEQARALEEAKAGRTTYPVSPENQAFGLEALERRRAAERAKAGPAKPSAEQALETDQARVGELESRLADERARASEAGFEDLRAREDMAAKGRVAGRYDVGRQGLAGIAGSAARPGTLPPDEFYPGSEEPGFGPYGTGSKPPEEFKPTTEEAKPTAEEAKKAGFTDEDWLMMGLNMLQAQPGQPGGALSQLMSNVGRSGLATLASRREREQREMDKLYKTAYQDYLQALGGKAKEEAAYLRESKSEDAKRMQVIKAVESEMEKWQAANFGATPAEAAAQRQQLYAAYSSMLGLTPLGGAAQRGSNLFRVLPD